MLLRGPVAGSKYKGQFSGHEKFPLRYGWLTKLHDEFLFSGGENLYRLLKDQEAISVFGVGKNMVSAMRHWGIASGLFCESNDTSMFEPTELGERLLGEDGWDPYLEEPASLWLLHWRFAGWPYPHNGTHKTTTWHWIFNNPSIQQISKDDIVQGLAGYAETMSWSRAAKSTLSGDVECFLRTYVYSRNRNNQMTEDSLECPLAELNLISEASKGVFEFNRGSKPSLPNPVFNFALAEFWDGFSSANTLSVDAITYEPGSPGMAFKLDENQVADRLSDIEHSTNGHFQWTETAGLRQVVRVSKPSCLADLLEPAFGRSSFEPKAA